MVVLMAYYDGMARVFVIRPLPSWRLGPFKYIEIEPERVIVKEKALATWAISGSVVYSGASGHNDNLGAAVFMLDKD